MVVKLDMTKAYDMVSWIFLTEVLRKFGFSEVIIDMLWMLSSNNWYSVCLNRQSYGVFKPLGDLNKVTYYLPLYLSLLLRSCLGV